VGRKSEIDILSSFDNDRPQSAAEIVKKTGLPRSTVFRALRLLVEHGFLHQQSGTSGYVLGYRVLQLGLIARQQLSPEEIVSAPLLALAAQTKETVTFSLSDVPWRLCVYVLDAPSDLRSVAQAGARYGLHRGGASSAILANLPEEVITETLRFHGVPQREFPAMLARLAEVRRSGAAISVGQRVAGATGVAAPIFVAGTIFGSVAVAGPSERMAPRVEEFRTAVIKVAVDLGQRLSARPKLRQEVAR
jgi:DNA-binding IclR family transcriptional regulator